METTMTTYEAFCEGEPKWEIEAESLEDALDKAEFDLRRGEWDLDEGGVTLHVSVTDPDTLRTISRDFRIEDES